jgi:hypothetical protein
MIVVGEVSLSVVQQHEEATTANARLGGYHMDLHCPTDEFRCFRVILDQRDDARLYLLGLTEFINQTRGQTCRLRDVVREAASVQRVASFITGGLDLRTGSGLELVLVCRELQSAPLVAIDGNHRAMAQYLTHDSVEGVGAFVCVHPAISNWPFVPPLART